MARIETPACPGCGISVKILVPHLELAAGQYPSLKAGDQRQLMTGWCPRCYEAESLAREMRAIPALVLG